MNYTIIIGLEVHVQLFTESKIFCGCPNKFNPDNPNVQTCPVCLGLPGSLPVMNRKAFWLSVKTATALDCEIAKFTKWDRKQYYYPDLPKAYQISQYDLPFSSGGWLDFQVDGESTRVRLIRVHLEEDAGKNIHDESGRGRDSQVDLNRAGTPLLEIVSEPDIRSPKQARRYLEDLKLLLTYLGVSDCNMQEGSLRCDANINLHIDNPDGEPIPTPLVEIKNLNSFRNVELACDFEIKRQFEAWNESGKRFGEVSKSTRGWDAKREITFDQRGKEEASDYRYFPDPDLLPIVVTQEQIDEIRSGLCELPAARRQRFCEESQLSDYDAAVIIDKGNSYADYFEDVVKDGADAKQAANWLTQDVLRDMNERRLAIDDFPIRPPELSALLKKIAANEITTKSARDVFSQLMTDADEGQPVSIDRIEEIIEEKGLAIVSDTGQLGSIIDAVIAKNEKSVMDFKAGKQKAIGALIGQVMRELKGADPKTVRQMLIEKLSS